jgi:hypothetical protein
MELKEYITYAENNIDEKPLYLFDNKFFERAPDMLHDYTILPYPYSSR